MKVLIFGTMYLRDEKSCLFVNAWYECWRRYNSQHDFLLIDSNSDEKWLQKLDIPVQRDIRQYDDVFSVRIDKRETIVSFPDNIGHLFSTGRDGWGRAFCAGIANATYNHYDYAVHIESDLLFKGRVSDIVEEMREKSYPVLSTKSWVHGFLETGLMFMNVSFLNNICFLSKYNWQSLTRKDYPEWIISGILGMQNIHLKYWIGDRNDFGQIKDDDVKKCIYLTHCNEQQVRLFMDSSGELSKI
jgi:hypothetical protein